MRNKEEYDDDNIVTATVQQEEEEAVEEGEEEEGEEGEGERSNTGDMCLFFSFSQTQRIYCQFFHVNFRTNNI